MISPVDLTKILVNKASITPDDGGCLDFISDLLIKENFKIEYLNFNNVKNLLALYGNEGPLMIFLGHVDVVPAGPLDKWLSPPFIATEKEGFIFGRGTADMKSAVAASISALLNFKQELISKNIKQNIRIGLLLTSDEEGVAIDGIRAVVKTLQERNMKIDYCLVGEPSCEKIFGDTIKIGRRGTLSGKLTLIGKQGHIAYPENTINPIHQFGIALPELLKTLWDEGNEHFSATSLQFSNVASGTGANNVIPDTLIADFNFRFSSNIDSPSLQEKFESILKEKKLNFKIDWHLGGLPFLTKTGALLTATEKSIKKIVDITPKYSTAGGTSDGRFIALMGTEVIEFGVINATIHQINEHVAIEEITLLEKIYLSLLQELNQHHEQ